MAPTQDALARYEERLIGWRKVFLLYRDRLDISYQRLLGNRGQVSVPLTKLTDMVEHVWVKNHPLHLVVFAAGVASGFVFFFLATFWDGIAALRPAAPYVLCGGAALPLLFMIVDPRRIDYLRAHLAGGSFLSIGAIASKVAERDQFYRAVMTQARASSVSSAEKASGDRSGLTTG